MVEVTSESCLAVFQSSSKRQPSSGRPLEDNQKCLAFTRDGCPVTSPTGNQNVLRLDGRGYRQFCAVVFRKISCKLTSPTCNLTPVNGAKYGCLWLPLAACGLAFES